MLNRSFEEFQTICQSYGIPDYMIKGIYNYIERRIKPGHFLTAVLENNLSEAVARADYINIELLPNYIRFLWQQVPVICWGSKEAVRNWLKGGRR